MVNVKVSFLVDGIFDDQQLENFVASFGGTNDR